VAELTILACSFKEILEFSRVLKIPRMMFELAIFRKLAKVFWAAGQGTAMLYMRGRKKQTLPTLISLVALFVVLLPLGAPITSFGASTLSTHPGTHLPLFSLNSSFSAKDAFSYVSNFESFTLEGWQLVRGISPSIVAFPNYSGEPSLFSSNSSGIQVNYANKGFVTRLQNLSYQVAIDAPTRSSTGYFGLATGNATDPLPVAIVGVRNDKVVVGRNIKSALAIEPIPKGTAYPPGWVYLMASIIHNESTGWMMQVYVDGTDMISANVSVPQAASYSGAMIETTRGGVYYSNIIVSSYQMPSTIPGYNNMQGYGQGSGLLVSLLPAYYNLTARMTLDSWSVPQNNILSFQINAMNSTGTTQSTCVGFFQLGVDINTNGRIAPWYVPGVNCNAHYDWPTQNGGPGLGGIHSPAGTQLVLSIVFEQASHKIVFQIVDTSTSQTFAKSIPYLGGAFYSTYTQMEFQPCCNTFPISSYRLHGELYDMQITTVKNSTVEHLPAGYMLPFNLDAPPSWDLTYYQNSISGYSEIG
jgi:hypothetical protein